MTVGILEAPAAPARTTARGLESKAVETPSSDPLQLAFAQHPIQALRHLEVSLDAGVAILSGTLPSYYNFQLAQETAMRFEGVTKVLTRLKVVYPKPARHENDWQLPI